MFLKSCLLQRRQKASIWGKGLIAIDIHQKYNPNLGLYVKYHLWNFMPNTSYYKSGNDFRILSKSDLDLSDTLYTFPSQDLTLTINLWCLLIECYDQFKLFSRKVFSFHSNSDRWSWLEWSQVLSVSNFKMPTKLLILSWNFLEIFWSD